METSNHQLDDDEYRVLRWYIVGVTRNRSAMLPRWTQAMTSAFSRMVMLGWIEQDWITSTTTAGKAAMLRHRRGGR